MGLFKKFYDTVTDVYDDIEDSVKDNFGVNTGSGQPIDLTGVKNFGGAKPPPWMTDPRGTVTEALETAADTTTSNLEGIIEDNNDSLADLESGINTTVSDAVDNLETNVEGAANIADSGVSIINMTSDIIAQGLDASINTNNPNSLVSNPSKWAELNTEGAASGDWFFDSEEAKDTMASKGADVLSDAFEPMYDVLGGLTTEVGQLYTNFGTSLGSQFMPGPTVAGDPFALGDKAQRRDILQQRTFKDRGAGIAPSRINQGGYGNIG